MQNPKTRSFHVSIRRDAIASDSLVGGQHVTNNEHCDNTIKSAVDPGAFLNATSLTSHYRSEGRSIFRSRWVVSPMRDVCLQCIRVRVPTYYMYECIYICMYMYVRCLMQQSRE